MFDAIIVISALATLKTRERLYVLTGEPLGKRSKVLPNCSTQLFYFKG